ncbi:MAG: MarR family winged helix-turn-helix transcriptional regulator [Gemmatimonadota bacterium]
MAASERQEHGRSLELWAALTRAFEAVREHAARDLARHDLSPGEFGVLAALGDGRALRPCDLRREVLVSSGGITYLVDRLEDRGLVSRRLHPDDRRARLVELTGDGRELLGRIRPQHAAALEYATSGLDSPGKRRAVELLRDLGSTAADLDALDEA